MEAWSFEHAVDCTAPLDFAWRFWTDVRNWAIDADVESVEMDGPFATGTRARTFSKSSGRIEWQLAHVEPGTAVIEFPLNGAVGRFVWTFVATPGGVRLTQRLVLDGPNAESYAAAFGPAMQSSIPAGMQKLCEAIESAHKER